MNNIFTDPDMTLPDIQDAVARAYIDGPNGWSATQESVDALMKWVSERYVSAHILDMTVRGILNVNIDPNTMEPLFTNTDEATSMLEAAELNKKSTPRPLLKVVK